MLTTPEAPERSMKQRREALIKANYTRIYRSALKKKIKDREISVLPILADPPEEVKNMKLHELLLAMPKVGAQKVRRIFLMLEISPVKTVGGLTPRQRNRLAEFIINKEHEHTN